MSPARALPHRHTWLRALVLLLAVLVVPGPPAGVPTAPAASAETVEYDVLDTALRPPARGTHRPVARPRRTPRPAPASAAPEGHPLPAPPRPPYLPRALRTVVLRC